MRSAFHRARTVLATGGARVNHVGMEVPLGMLAAVARTEPHRAIRVGVWGDPADPLFSVFRDLPGVLVVDTATSPAGADRIFSIAAPDVVIVATAQAVADATAIGHCCDQTRGPLLILVGQTPADAIAAFELRAFDFIVRPPTPERLQVAFDRVREWQEQGRILRLMAGVMDVLRLASAEANPSHPDVRLIVSEGEVLLRLASPWDVTDAKPALG